MKQFFRVKSTLALALLVQQAAIADTYKLEDSVVTATGMAVSTMQSPASITRISAEQIERSSAADVAELFRDIPGVSLSDSATPGMKRIAIRGESSRRVVVKIDGQTMTDHSNYGTPLLIDPALIDHIEVVRGPSSVINGANAIGGVVNIITKRGGSEPLQGYASGGYYSATQGYRAGAGLYGGMNGFDYRLALSRSEHGDRRTRSGSLDNSDYDTESVAAHLGYGWGKHYLAFKAEQFNLSANGWLKEQPGVTASMAFPVRDQTRYAVFYEASDLSPWLRKLTLDGYQRTVDREFDTRTSVIIPPPVPIQRRDIDILSEDEQLTRGLAARSELELIGGQPTLFGLEYMDDRLDTEKNAIRTSVMRAPVPPVTTTDPSSQKASQQMWSAFLQQRWNFSEQLTGYLGARYYSVDGELERSTGSTFMRPASETDDKLLGSLGLVWAPNSQWSYRASYAQGYSFPSLSQLYLITRIEGSDHYGNPDLKPEQADTFELGVRHESSHLLLDAALFRTSAKDYISRQGISSLPDYYGQATPTALPAGAVSWVNISKATTEGLELVAEWRALGAFTPHASLLLAQRTFDHGNGYRTGHSGLPKKSGTLGVRHFSVLGNGLGSELDLFVRAADGARLNNQDGEILPSRRHLDRASGYATLNLAWNLDFGDRASTRVLLGNLLNRDYRAIDEIPGMKRHLDVEFTVEF